MGDSTILDGEGEVGFVLWSAATGNESRQDWEKLGAEQDKWRRLARVAIDKFDVLRMSESLMAKIDEERDHQDRVTEKLDQDGQL